MDHLPDLTFLSEEETNLIFGVLQRDVELRHGQKNRASQVKKEVHDLRMKSVLRNGDDQTKMCARCKTPFGFLFNTGDVCPVCRFRVCKDCREARINSHGWMCTLCFKENQLRWLSGATLAGTPREKRDDDGDDPSESDPGVSHFGTSDSTSVSESLLIGGRHPTQRQQAGHPTSMKSQGSRATTTTRPADLPSPQSFANSPRPKKDQGDADSGFSTPVSPEDASAAGKGPSPCLEKETPDRGEMNGNPSTDVERKTALLRKGAEDTDGENCFSERKKTNSTAALVKTDTEGDKEATCVATLKTAEETSEPSNTVEDYNSGHKQATSRAQKTAELKQQSSSCSFTSSDVGETTADEVSPSPDKLTAVPSQGKKEEMDSSLTQSSGYASTHPADSHPGTQDRKPDCSHASPAAEPTVKSQADTPGSTDAYPNQQEQRMPRTSNAHATASRNPMPRQCSGSSDAFSACSAKTASPGTKIRLLDLASNRALERDEDSVRSWSGGSEDTLSLGLSCSGLPVSAQAPVIHTGGDSPGKAHEAERQRALTPDQSQSTEMDHLDGGSQSTDRDHLDSVSQSNEAATMSERTQRSNSMGDLTGDSAHVSQLPSQRRAFTGSVDQLNHQDDEIDGGMSKYRKRNKPLSRSRFSLAASRESLGSVYSAAGEINYGRIPVTGDITFGLEYDQKLSALRVHLKGCQDLAPVDTKHNRSDPYVKTYLLPDKSRSGKRKSKIKKRTLSPVYNETLSYTISPGELETRTLWVTVWHSDRLGRNDFLGEVNLPMEMELFDNTAPRTYPLQSRITADSPDETAVQYKGDLILSLMYVTAEKAQEAREAAPKKSKSKLKKSKAAAATSPQGEIHVMIKSARHLMALRSSGASDPFVKGYLLPERSRAGKQKTQVVKNSLNPMWNHILVFEGVDVTGLADRSLELTVWDHEKLGTNEFLGGTRLNLGLGMVKDGQQVVWMDGRGEESAVWQNMMERPDTWVDAEIPLRASMGKTHAKK